MCPAAPAKRAAHNIRQRELLVLDLVVCVFRGGWWWCVCLRGGVMPPHQQQPLSERWHSAQPATTAGASPSAAAAFTGSGSSSGCGCGCVCKSGHSTSDNGGETVVGFSPSSSSAATASLPPARAPLCCANCPCRSSESGRCPLTAGCCCSTGTEGSGPSAAAAAAGSGEGLPFGVPPAAGVRMVVVVVVVACRAAFCSCFNCSC
eukprot:COSAG06_NODE_1158_length_10465_cov_13.338318_2_plen_205_part_00